jgi:Domain of unknown function (DUF4202)
MPDRDRRCAAVIAEIDAANARDPNHIEIEGRPEPAALIYGQRMSATLGRMASDASEHLRIAARGQHIERWTSPRKSYPEGRSGYLAWRNDLKEFHARRVGEIMGSAGYDPDDIARVRSLLRKERLKSDAEAQMLEDVACLVFLESYLGGFMKQADEEKLAGILTKTWKKMSPIGHEHALKLALSAPVAAALKAALSCLPPPRSAAPRAGE